MDVFVLQIVQYHLPPVPSNFWLRLGSSQLVPPYQSTSSALSDIIASARTPRNPLRRLPIPHLRSGRYTRNLRFHKPARPQEEEQRQRESGSEKTKPQQRRKKENCEQLKKTTHNRSEISADLTAPLYPCVRRFIEHLRTSETSEKVSALCG